MAKNQLLKSFSIIFRIKSIFLVLETLTKLIFSVFYIKIRYLNPNFKKLKALIPNRFGKISNPFEKRIFYYTTASAVSSICFSTLCNKKLTKKEYELLFWMGILAPAQDDLTDNPAIDFLRIRLITENKTEPKNITEYLAQYSAKSMIQYISDLDTFENYVQKTQIAQQNSRIQFDKNVTREILKIIEYEKGSTSTLMCRCLINSDLIKNEAEMIAQLGFLTQFLNDIFDVYKDREQQIFTLANIATQVEILVEELDDMLEKIVEKIQQLNYENRQKKQFLVQLLAISALGYVCLNQYQKLQKNGEFLVQNYTREQLICDMEKPRNILKYLKFALGLIERYKNKFFEC